jgi:hypothetical protein
MSSKIRKSYEYEIKQSIAILECHTMLFTEEEIQAMKALKHPDEFVPILHKLKIMQKLRSSRDFGFINDAKKCISRIQYSLRMIQNA